MAKNSMHASSGARSIIAEHRQSFSKMLVVFLSYFAFNAAAAVYAPFQDCDEVFNFWEPTHFLNHGYGLQTWEYAPHFALRSWLYIMPHSVAGKIALSFGASKAHELMWIRFFLAALCAYCQTRLHHAIARAVNSRAALIAMLTMVSTPGMFYSSVAYLPSSLSMYTAMLGLANMIDIDRGLQTARGIAWFGVGAILGWPFSGALILPLCIDEVIAIFRGDGLFPSLGRALRGGLSLVPLAALDISANFALFGCAVFSPLRLVQYNVLSGSDKGPNIFGTEPWHFYLRNLLLNFNVWFLLALLAGPLCVLSLLTSLPRSTKMTSARELIFTLPFYMWLLIFSLQPHKEERFMSPAYPFLCLNAALALHMMLVAVGHTHQTVANKGTSSTLKLLVVLASILLFVLVGLLRILGTVTAYQAPFQVFAPLQEAVAQDLPQIVCMGKEWYRYPSSFFLPPNVRANFIQSEFHGLLPGQFSEHTGRFGLPAAWTPALGMNDENKEDPSKTVDVSSCTFLVDSYFPNAKTTQLEPAYVLDEDTWTQLLCVDFLDATNTPSLARIFWTPSASIVPARLRRHWGKYCLLKRK